MRIGSVILFTLVSCMLVDSRFLLTTRERVDAKKAEMLKDYTRASSDLDRLWLYSAWNDADVRFDKKLLLYVDIRPVGTDVNEIGDDEVLRLKRQIRETASQVLNRYGFEVNTYNNSNQVELVGWIMKPRSGEHLYIIDGNLQYKRTLFDRQRAKGILATMHEQRSVDYTSRKQDIGELTTTLCMRSLRGFIEQMRDDETVMEVYYELLAKGLIEKDFQKK